MHGEAKQLGQIMRPAEIRRTRRRRERERQRRSSSCAREKSGNDNWIRGHRIKPKRSFMFYWAADFSVKWHAYVRSYELQISFEFREFYWNHFGMFRKAGGRRGREKHAHTHTHCVHLLTLLTESNKNPFVHIFIWIIWSAKPLIWEHLVDCCCCCCHRRHQHHHQCCCYCCVGTLAHSLRHRRNE